jgi:ribosomal protein S17E
MRVIKINKTYRNGIKNYYLLISDDSYSEDDINCIAEDFCESDAYGANYGYSYEWDFVDDKEIITKVLNDESKKISNQIAKLTKESYRIHEYLNKIK